MMVFSFLKKIWKKLKAKIRNFLDNPHFQLFGEYHFRVPLKEKVVALTFDDGPLDPYTSDLLAVLDFHNVKATFFLVGREIEKSFETAKLIHRNGHQIGNHSYSHKRFLSKSLKFMFDEIQRTDELIRSLGVKYRIDFRAPYGNKFLKLPYVLWKLGKKHILFDFFPNPRDWKGASEEDVVGSILEQVRPGSIIVLHDGNITAAPFVCSYTDLLIRRMKERGYRFVRVDEILDINKKFSNK